MSKVIVEAGATEGIVFITGSPAMPDARGATNNTFEQDFLPQEFARAQIGSAWYLISDPVSWKVVEKLTFQGGQWQDNGSTLGAGN